MTSFIWTKLSFITCLKGERNDNGKSKCVGLITSQVNLSQSILSLAIKVIKTKRGSSENGTSFLKMIWITVCSSTFIAIVIQEFKFYTFDWTLLQNLVSWYKLFSQQCYSNLNCLTPALRQWPTLSLSALRLCCCIC